MMDYDCPITCVPFVDPVINCVGQTYERKAIVEWFDNNDTDPLTGVILENKNIVTNYILKTILEKNVKFSWKVGK